MSSSEKFCLKWNDFQENIYQAFQCLREDFDFTDVTLACEDGKQLEAHKVVLAASSPIFQSLLKQNKHSHPLIYMRGIKSEDLLAILDFLYHGEANVYQQNLESFLAIAEDLKLKGLAGANQEIKTENNLKLNLQKENVARTEIPEERYQEIDQISEFKIFEHKNNIKCDQGTTVAIVNTKISVDIQELDEKIKSLMTTGEKMTTGSQMGQRTRICSICGKQGTLTNIKDHIEANHIEGIFHPCNICEKTFRSRLHLRLHKSSCHKH